jgi:hypothetical protein
MVKRNGERFTLVRGHRRLLACKQLFKDGKIGPIRVPAQLVPRGTSEIDLLVDQHTSNTGKPYNMMEYAMLVKKLLAHNLTEKEIATKFGKQQSWVKKCIMLLEAPEAVKNMIRNNRISPTLVCDIFRDNNYDDAVQKLSTMDALIPSEIKNGKGKLTKSAANKVENKHNSLSIMRRLVIKPEGRVVRKDKQDVYEFVQALIDGDMSKEKIEKELYEPLPSTQGKK